MFVNNQLGNSAVTVASSGTLAGTGSAAGTVTASGTIAPGASGTSAGTLATGAAALTGIYVCQIDGATADRWNITGNLNVTGATLAVSEIRTATFTSAVIAKYSGTLTGTFTVSPALPFGIAVQYDATAKEIRLVSNFNSWTGSHTFAAGSDTSPSGDPDGDGMTNRREYAFGLDPTSGTSHNPIPVPLAKDNASFTYTRRKPSLTGLAYKIWTSPDLVEWTVDTGATQSPVDQGDNQTVHVLLGSPGPFANGNLFVRVSAD